jgi:hypothetical protein
MKRLVSLWAGNNAIEWIREKGLSPDDVEVVAGAAGGPKWLIVRHLDRHLFSSWLALRKRPLFFLGSSIGAWRFAAACQKDPCAAFERFEQAYMGQAYESNPPQEAIDQELRRILDRLIGADGAEEILAHPKFRLNIMTVRCKGLTAHDERFRLMAGLFLAAASNFMLRRFLGIFFERILFYDRRDRPPFYRMRDFPLRQVPLTMANLKPALAASGAIPLLMSGVKNIAGTDGGTYRDGGIIDYHMNIDFLGRKKGLVLFPHYAEKIVPGWLDKHIPWRKPDLGKMSDVLMVAPSKRLTDSLALKKVPDRKDFYTFSGRDGERIAYWRQALDAGERLADEFMELAVSGRIASELRPISELCCSRPSAGPGKLAPQKSGMRRVHRAKSR